MATHDDSSGDAAAQVPLSKEQRKLQERAATSLMFLDRIDRVAVMGTTYRDEREHVQFRVIMKDSSEHAAQLSARKARRDAKRMQPVVTYDNIKAVSTLRGVHVAVHEWSAKHAGATALDGTSLCAYCSQFNAPAALQLWKWHEPEPQSSTPALTVVVNSGAAHANSALRKMEVCLNSYLACAQQTAQAQSDCQGCIHIPALVASFLQNEDYSSVPVNVVLFSCAVM